jgi:alkaline phosphatase D
MCIPRPPEIKEAPMSAIVLPRRGFVTGSLASAAAVACPFGMVRGAPVAFKSDPYTLGVASGSPRETSVILWTRLAPQPTEDGGMPPDAVEVEWQVAEDEKFERIAARGTVQASAELAHSVHAEATGLKPGRTYWYRFRAGDAVSPVGRTKTAPAAGVDRFRLAFASCQHYEQGYYTAYRHMAARDLDLVVHLGDYIYETSWGRKHVRNHGAGVPVTLAEYRARYGLYKSDPDLKAAHAAVPWLSTWDDHEVRDDYANDHSYMVRDPLAFMKIRAAAYQAYYEHMPLPPSARPHGPEAVIYNHYRFGDLIDMVLLDDRQYRSASACVHGGRPTVVPDCPERTEESRTMLGGPQEQWFDARMRTARGRWTIVAQQTLMAEVKLTSDQGDRFWLDGWDGYPNARRRLLESIATHKPRNPVVIGGDRHSFFAADLKRDPARPEEATVASEFVGTSITSDGPGENATRKMLTDNPAIHYGRGDKRGYAMMELSPKTCAVQFQALDDVRDANSAIGKLASFVVEDGVPGAKWA